MKHTFRFLAEKLETGGWSITDPGEIEHLRRVLRLQTGTVVEVFNGKGVWGEGVLTAIGKDHCAVDAGWEKTMEPEGRPLAIAMGAVRPGDMDDVIPALTELGVDQIHVFYQEGGDPGRMGEKVAERWRRILIAAAKQCKRPWVPEIHTHHSLVGAMTALRNPAESEWRGYFGQPGAAKSLVAEAIGVGGAGIVLGSERGLNADECQSLIGGGFEPVSFGEHVLRARTAAIAAMAIMGARRGLT